MSEDRSEYLGYGKKSHNEDNKEQRHVIKETKTSFTLRVPAFTKNGALFIGWSNLTLNKVNEEGIAEAKANFSQRDLIDLNRQKITDVRNNLARTYKLKALIAKVKAGKGTPAEVAKVFAALAKSSPELVKAAEKLLVETK